MKINEPLAHAVFLCGAPSYFDIVILSQPQRPIVPILSHFVHTDMQSADISPKSCHQPIFSVQYASYWAYPKWLSCLGPLYFPDEEGTDLKGVELNVGELAKEDVD